MTEFIPNKPTQENLAAIENVINEFPRDTPGLSAVREAFANYKRALTKPVSIYTYIKDRIEKNNGKIDFSANEWRIFTAALGFRVLPALGELGSHIVLEASANMLHHGLDPNWRDEKGDPAKRREAHATLFFNSLGAFGHRFGVQLMDDVSIYEMVYRIIDCRKDGIKFTLPPEDKAGDAKEYARFMQEMTRRRLTLPHELNIPIGGRIQHTKKNRARGLVRHDNIENFRIACELAALLPDEIGRFRKATEEWSRRIADPNDSLQLVLAEIGTLTREGNAAKGSHIDAFDMALQSRKAELGPLADMALLWSQIHNGEQVGVEDSHSNDARVPVEDFIRVHLKKDPEVVAQALRVVTQHRTGYIQRQEKHWDMVVKALQEEHAKEEPVLELPSLVEKFSVPRITARAKTARAVG